ncbi:MAG: DUF3696 domain-containing protein [Rubrivivax sp.]
MAISKLIVGGFKCFRDSVEIPIAPITLMFGPNSAGKSAVRDALFELRRKLSLERDREKSLAADAVAALAGDSAGHQLPTSEEGDEPQHANVLLGCEVDHFEPNGSGPLAAYNEWTELGQGLYFSLRGRAVRYEFVDGVADSTLTQALSVDGHALLEYVEAAAAATAGVSQSWPEPPFTTRIFRSVQEPGLLRLNLAHEILADAQFTHLVQEVLDRVKQLSEVGAGGLVWMADDAMCIRAHAYKRTCRTWVDWTEELGLTSVAGEMFGSLIEPLRRLFLTTNELVRQVEHSLAIDVGIAHVPASRSLLGGSDVTADWFGVGEYDNMFVPEHSVQAYARWLGFKALDGEEVPHQVSAELRGRDDLVNDVLGSPGIAARRYTIEAAVSVREERQLQPIDHNWSAESAWSVHSQLFLRDEDGRRLDFAQVGSGISYVLPVLTALWAAKWSLIEQPELHLHPAAQCEIGDAVVRAFNRGRFTIVETHSEHLLLRILKRVRQTSADRIADRELRCHAEAIVALYFAPRAGGTTTVHQLRVTRAGEFKDRWPDGFFEERSRELFDE